MTRRALLRAGCGAGSLLLMQKTVRANAAGSPASQEERTEQDEQIRQLIISVVQFRSTKDLPDNVERHRDYIRRCAGEGSHVVVFPECSITGFFDDAVTKASPAELAAAEAEIAAAAKKANVYVIAGIPTKDRTKTYNSAIVITPKGKVLERYHKVQLAGEPWATPGDHLSVFPIEGVLCSIIVCHDERYPELVRLPVLAGARIVFYISHESGMKQERKIVPYRAQIVARAVENSVYVAQANAPAERKTLEGSHGQSRIIGPNGIILREAGIYEEEVVSAVCDLTKATGHLAKQSLGCDFLKAWWQAGMTKVRRISG